MTPLVDSYIELLKEYNSHTNVYSKSTYDQLAFHIQDSINVAGLVSECGDRVVDLGSGSGLPSVIIAIHNPHQKVVALESKERKRRFLQWVKDELGLVNYEVYSGDIQMFKHHRNDMCGAVTAKAFAKAPKVLQVARGLACKKGRLVIPVSKNQFGLLPKAISRFGREVEVAGVVFNYIVHPL